MVKPPNRKQLLFIDGIMSGMTQANAAIAAGYSAKSAEVLGCKLAKLPQVAVEIARRRLLLEKRFVLTADKILEGLGRQVDFDPGEMEDSEGNPLPLHKMPEHIRKCIASIEETRAGRKYKFVNRLGSQELGAKIIGLLKPEEQNNAVVIQVMEKPQVTVPTVEAPKLLPDFTD